MNTPTRENSSKPRVRFGQGFSSNKIHLLSPSDEKNKGLTDDEGDADGSISLSIIEKNATEDNDISINPFEKNKKLRDTNDYIVLNDTTKDISISNPLEKNKETEDNERNRKQHIVSNDIQKNAVEEITMRAQLNSSYKINQIQDIPQTKPIFKNTPSKINLVNSLKRERLYTDDSDDRAFELRRKRIQQDADKGIYPWRIEGINDTNTNNAINIDNSNSNNNAVNRDNNYGNNNAVNRDNNYNDNNAVNRDNNYSNNNAVNRDKNYSNNNAVNRDKNYSNNNAVDNNYSNNNAVDNNYSNNNAVDNNYSNNNAVDNNYNNNAVNRNNNITNSSDTINRDSTSSENTNAKNIDKTVKTSKWECIHKENYGKIKEDDIIQEDGYVVPKVQWDGQLNFQKVGVKWQCKQYTNKCGGIQADDMGQGKTIQVAGYQHTQEYTNWCKMIKINGPIQIVCPTTVIAQWQREQHIWIPQCRIIVLHDSIIKQKNTKKNIKKDLTVQQNKLYNEYDINKNLCIGITSYSMQQRYSQEFLRIKYMSIFLDEGHKIRNPESQISMVCKHLQSIHRIVQTGIPIQNNFQELWNLMDFTNPGKLGSQEPFMEEFASIITAGGYSNASEKTIRTAIKCSKELRKILEPYQQQRRKIDVIGDVLPSKKEQILFCDATSKQRRLYNIALNNVYSNTVGDSDVLHELHIQFSVITNLRKICNHPSLYDGEPIEVADSCKQLATLRLLRVWRKDGHKSLLFSQSRRMQDIQEAEQDKQGFITCRLDGTTEINKRVPLVMAFNNEDSKYEVMQQTTRAGGLGQNQTGASRVIIYDPDWNPATDAQSCDRVYRIGQKKSVVIYRQQVKDSIEEKIYHRQVFKELLASSVLKAANPAEHNEKVRILKHLFTQHDIKEQLHPQPKRASIKDKKIQEHTITVVSPNTIDDKDICDTTTYPPPLEPINSYQQNEDEIVEKVLYHTEKGEKVNILSLLDDTKEQLVNNKNKKNILKRSAIEDASIRQEALQDATKRITNLENDIKRSRIEFDKQSFNGEYSGPNIVSSKNILERLRRL